MFSKAQFRSTNFILSVYKLHSGMKNINEVFSLLNNTSVLETGLEICFHLAGLGVTLGGT